MIGHNNKMKHRGLFLFLSFTTAFFATTSVRADSDSEADIIARIKPAGVVCVAGEPCEQDAPAVAAAAPANAASSAAPAAAGRSGEEVYNSSCALCHGAGVAGAPIVGDKAAWAGRIAKGVDALVNSAINGINAMPPRGTCMSCSDQELQASVQYMVDSSK